MAKFRGTVNKSDLEGGVLQLLTEDGTVYELEGAADALKPGARVEVEGTVDRGALSFTMTGPRLKVKTAKTL